MQGQSSLWDQCKRELKAELPERQFNTWIGPLQPIEDERELRLLAPNKYVVDFLKSHYLEKIQLLVTAAGTPLDVVVEVGSLHSQQEDAQAAAPSSLVRDRGGIESRLNTLFTFDSFVEGRSNQLAKAAALQVAENAGRSYNPLFIYGGVGLGKTHLMQSIGNAVVAKEPGARVAYVHSERFVGDMVRALQHNKISEFKNHYRSLDALLIDDIQFFAGKER